MRLYLNQNDINNAIKERIDNNHIASVCPIAQLIKRKFNFKNILVGNGGIYESYKLKYSLGLRARFITCLSSTHWANLKPCHIFIKEI